jgi:hypothetical protein
MEPSSGFERSRQGRNGINEVLQNIGRVSLCRKFPCRSRRSKPNFVQGLMKESKFNRTTSHYYYILSTQGIFLEHHQIAIIDEFEGLIAVIRGLLS